MPSGLISLPSARSCAQTRLILHTSGPGRREPGSCCGTRQVMASGSPAPLGYSASKASRVPSRAFWGVGAASGLMSGAGAGVAATMAGAWAGAMSGNTIGAGAVTTSMRGRRRACTCTGVTPICWLTAATLRAIFSVTCVRRTATLRCMSTARGESRKPPSTGRARATTPAPARATRLPAPRRRAAAPVMISRTRPLRSAPVAPAAQASGDWMQNLQTLRMPPAYTSGSWPCASTLSSQARSRSAISRAPISHTGG